MYDKIKTEIETENGVCMCYMYSGVSGLWKRGGGGVKVPKG